MMRYILILTILMVTLFANHSFAQSKKKNKKNKTVTSEEAQPNAYSPFDPSANDEGFDAPNKTSNKKRVKQKAKSGYNLSFDKKIEEFEDRMEANAKRYKKMEKQMQKPQYSDPSYFGHKKKPKKRSVKKRKFCKECGLTH